MVDRATALAQICEQYQVDILYAFGSRAREVLSWLENPDLELPAGPSDVDIGAKSLPSVDFDFRAKVGLAIAIEDLLQVNRVDLVSLADADPFLAANIIRGERLFARDSYTADNFDLYILRRAGDLAPFERERLDHIWRIHQ